MLPFLEKETNIACPRSSGNLVNDKFPCSISQSSLPPDLKQLCSCPSQLSERYVAPTSDSAGGLSDKALKPLFVRSYERPRGPQAQTLHHVWRTHTPQAFQEPEGFQPPAISPTRHSALSSFTPVERM